MREWKEILIVAGIIALRAALTFLIHWEIKEEEKAERHTGDGGYLRRIGYCRRKEDEPEMRIRWKWKILLPLFLLLLLIPGSVSDASQKRRTGTGQVVEIPDKWTAFTGNINTHKEPELKILIAGNSLSGLNDMGETLQKLAQAGGHRIQVEVLWKNGCPLYRYASASHTMGKRLRRLLKSQEWDYVILQENTPNVISEDSSVPKAAQRLSKLIRKYGAEPMFLETWAPEEGHKVYKKADYQGISRGQLQRRVKRLFKRLEKRTRHP